MANESVLVGILALGIGVETANRRDRDRRQRLNPIGAMQSPIGAMQLEQVLRMYADDGARYEWSSGRLWLRAGLWLRVLAPRADLTLEKHPAPSQQTQKLCTLLRSSGNMIQMVPPLRMRLVRIDCGAARERNACTTSVRAKLIHMGEGNAR